MKRKSEKWMEKGENRKEDDEKGWRKYNRRTRDGGEK